MSASILGWRAGLHAEWTEQQRWAPLQRYAEALRADLETARSSWVDVAQQITGASSVALLAVRSQGDVRVVAGSPLARPAGALVPGARAWKEVLHAHSSTSAWTLRSSPAWLLHPPSEPVMELRASVLQPARTLGVLVACTTGATEALAPTGPIEVLAAMSVALLTAPAQRTTRTGKEDGQRLSRLTARERQVLALLPLGMTNAQLGRRLGVGVGTVKSHVEHLLSKLGCPDRTSAAVLAVRLGVAA